MRVTHIITRLIVGGAQENTISSVLGLRQKPGMDVRLISGPTYGSEGSLEEAFAAHPGVLRVLPELVRPVHPWLDLRALRKLTALLNETKPHIVHTHSGKAGVIGRIAAARAGVPVIFHTIHGPSFGPFQGALANLVFSGAERYAAKFTTGFVVVADAMREQYLAKGIGTPEQYTKVFSGFPLEPFLSVRNDLSFRSKLGIRPDDIIIGKIARLAPLKGHHDLIESAPALLSRCPKARFLFVGNGELRSEIEARVQSLGLGDRFIFVGLVPPHEVPFYIGMMDVLVHLSLREGLARALPQALAAAKPVIAYNCDGAREVCLDGETGFLLKPGDRAGLVDKLALLCADGALRGKFGRSGRAFVESRFSESRMVDELHALYLRHTPS